MARSSGLGAEAGVVRRILVAATALAAVCVVAASGGGVAGAGAGSVAGAQEPQEQEIALLFAQTANRGTMKPIQGHTPRFNLKLRGVNSQVVWFSDRPARQSGHISVREFNRSWAGFGFVEDPPNAALTLLRAGDSQDTVVMELGRPHFNKKKEEIRYSARLLDEATGNLSHLSSDLDSRVNRRFRSPSLFIDDATGRVVNGCLIQPNTQCYGADLSGADLSGADLTLARLAFARLTRANLSDARLVIAGLSNTDLRGAVLTRADVRGANLSGSNLSGANLVDADLSGGPLGVAGAELEAANLEGADLEGADLSRADLSRADLSAANLRHADLRGTRFCHTTMPSGSINNSDCR